MRLDYDHMSESELVRHAREGHDGAFRAIMQRSNRRLFRVARSVVRDHAEAEDVLQETYARAFQKLGSFREEASLLTWLTRIALNQARGRLRNRGVAVGVEAIEAAQRGGGQIIMFNSASQLESPESSAARGQMRALIEQAVDELPEPFRIVFVMRAVEECSIEETAAILDLQPETVKTRLHRARRLLRNALNEKLALALTDIFPFLGSACERLIERSLGGRALFNRVATDRRSGNLFVAAGSNARRTSRAGE